MPHFPERTTPDVLIVGAGPIGLQAAILAKRAGLAPVVFDQGCIVNAIYNYPTYMTFFTTSERLEIGGHPLVTATGKPTRKEALDYYRKVAQNEQLDVRQFTAVEQITRQDSGFRLTVRPANAAPQTITAPIVIVATGYFDTPKQLGVPGEDLQNVSHYYTEAHPFHNRNVVIVGAGSSAADAALDLFRAGAKVTMIHRGDDFRHSLKYWIRPDLVNRVKEGSITAHMNSTVRCITPQAVLATGAAGQELVIPTDQTFLLTGYYADPALLNTAGVNYDDTTLAAQLNPETFESNVPGLFVIGSAGTGQLTSDVFIENGLVHATSALNRITALLR